MWVKRILILSTILFCCSVNFLSAQQVKQFAFEGRVVDANGTAVEGAKVCLYEMKYVYGGIFYEPNLAGEMITPLDGSFSFKKNSESGLYYNRYIVAEKTGFAIGWAEWAVTENKEEDIKLNPARDVEGIVFDENDKAIAGAQVSVYRMLREEEGKENSFMNEMPSRLLTVVTDQSGKFTFANLPSQTEIDFTVRKPGYATICTELTAQSEKYMTDQAGIKLTLPVEAKLEGIVCEKDTGKPVGGVKMMVIDDNRRSVFGIEPDISGDDGRFSIGALTAGQHILRLVQETKELAEWVAEPLTIDLDAGKTKSDVKVELSKGGLLEVHVTDAATGKAIKGADASVYNEKRRLQSFSSISDENGISRIRLLQGTYRISYVYAGGYTSFMLRDEIPVEEGRSKQFHIQLTPQQKVEGIVTDESGSPVEGAVVMFQPMSMEQVTTDSEGKFEIVRDRSMLFELEADESSCLLTRHDKRNLAGVVEIGEGARTVNIRLQPGITASGKVVDSDGNALAKVQVIPMLRMTRMSSSFGANVKTDDSGGYEIKNIPVGCNFDIRTSAEGYGVGHLEFNTNNPVDKKVSIETLTLPSANLSISGKIVDAAGNPVAQAAIQASGEIQPRLQTTSDDNGNFTLKGLCAGQVYLQITGQYDNKSFSAPVYANAGMQNIKIIVGEGRSAPQYIRTETYEQVLQTGEMVIAGVVVDENDTPVADVSVGVNCIKREREDAPGKFMWTFSSYQDLRNTTDKQGRFAIALKEDAQYDLIFSPNSYAATLVYDVPAGKKDLKVVLENGGMISGQLVRLVDGKKVPIRDAQVKLEQPERASYTHLGFDRDQTTITDSQGRFRFKHIQTKIRPRASMSQSEWEFVPRVWQLVYGETVKTFAFYDKPIIDNFEFLLEPDLTNSQSLIAKSLPGFDGIRIDLDTEQTSDKTILICFFDIEQRPSRSCLLQLSQQASQLKEKNIEIIAIHASQVEQEYLDNWLNENNISFPVGIVDSNEEQTRFNWGVKGLPWLVLTDKEHIVIDEGFSITELDEKI